MATQSPRLTSRWLVLPLLLAIAILNYADRYLLAGLVGPIKNDFGLSDSFVGLLLGPAFALVYTIAAIPIARIADRTSRVMVVSIGCLVWSGFTALTAFATDAWMLAAARVGVGIGEAAYQAPVAALIAAYFPPHQRGRALALVGTSIYFGQMLGLAGGPAIAADHGWRTAFQVIGLTGIIVAVTAWTVIREPAHSEEVKATPHPKIATLARELVATPALRNMTLGLSFGTLSGIAFGLWGPALFERAYGISNAEAGTAFAVSFGLPGLLGVLGFGVLADKLSKDGHEWPVRLSAIALFAATACILAVVWMPEIWMAKALAIPSGILGGGWSIGIIAGLQYVLPDRSRATGTAFALLMMSLFGNFIGPWITGILSDSFTGSQGEGLRIGLSIVIPTGFLGAWFIWRAVATIRADRDRLHGQSSGREGAPGMAM
ncbi:MAG: MFS transporter [Sphingomonadaceae bacterium]